VHVKASPLKKIAAARNKASRHRIVRENSKKDTRTPALILSDESQRREDSSDTKKAPAEEAGIVPFRVSHPSASPTHKGRNQIQPRSR
jgi:hypothetical protein